MSTTQSESSLPSPDSPDPSDSPEKSSTNPVPGSPDGLHGLDPGELLARGMDTVKPSGSMHDWTPPTPEELSHLLPQYQIESLLGRGGMGAVYKGFQEKLGRPVAIKLLPAELTADAQFVTRFEREARTLAKLHHPGIVAIHDFGQTPDGHLYFVMEYVEGTDLRHILQGSGLQPGQALEIITQICEALHAAHEQGVIHRDIKPANILLTADGRVKLADFGLARPDREEHEALTVTNAILGTPDYMAPEQKEGRSDTRADIYALGVMLYEMLTGQLPRGAWPPPSRKVSVDVRIDEVVIKALQQEPDLRYQQASEMKTDVDSIRSGPAAASPAPNPQRRRLAWAALLAVLVLAAGSAFWFAEKSRPAPAASKAAKALAAESSLAPGEPMLKETRVPEDDYGLEKYIYTPTRSDLGLVVRYTATPAFLEKVYGEKFDESAVYEQAWKPRPGVGSPVQIMFGNPIWHREEANEEMDNIYLLRLSIGPRTPIVEMQKFPFLNLDSEWLYDSERCMNGSLVTFKRYKNGIVSEGDPGEVWFKVEVTAMHLDELKVKYPELKEPNKISVVSGKTYWEVDSVKERAAKAEGESAKLQDALLSSQWKYVTRRTAYSFERTMLFLKDGTAWLFDDVNKRQWDWTLTGPKTARLTCEDRAIELTFDDSLAKFTGRETGENQPWGETAFESLQTTPLTEESRNQILEKLKNVTAQRSWPKPLDPSVLKGVAGPRKADDDLESNQIAAGERALLSIVGRGNSDILFGNFTATKGDLALVVRWTVKPALLPEWLRKKSGENSVFEWVQFPHEGEKNTVTIEPAGLANDDNHDNDTLSARFSGAKGIPFFVSEKIPWRDITKVTQKTYGDQVIITYDHGSGDARETWLKVEVFAAAPDDIWDAYPGMYRSSNVAKFYIDGEDAANPDEATGAKPSAYKPPLLASWTGKLLHTSSGPDEYGLEKDVYSAARGTMGLVVRWAFTPGLMDDWLKQHDYAANTTYETIVAADGNGHIPTVTLLHGIPIWNEANKTDAKGGGNYMVRLLGRPSDEPWLRCEKKPQPGEPKLSRIWEGDHDHAVMSFKRYKTGDDPGETWLKVEITALTAEEMKAKYPDEDGAAWDGEIYESEGEPLPMEPESRQ